MLDERIGSKCWARAANLKERASSVGNASGSPYDSGAAQRGLAQWLSQVPFQSNEFLQLRLASVGLNEDQFLYILGEPPDALQSLIQAPFLQDIECAFGNGTDGEHSFALPPSIAKEIHGGLVRPFEALVRLAAQRLESALQSLRENYPKPPFDIARIPAMLLPSLVQRFAQIVTRTLVLELNIARMEERLSGQTSPERFDSFLDFSSQREEVLRIVTEYPVLARQLAVCSELWLKASVEFLSYLCADWSAITAAFGGREDPGELVEVSNDAGDSHRGGRSVCICHFANGLRVVYKPRSLAIDLHFQELLGWINDHGMHPRLPQLIVLDRGDHGWQQFISAGTCTSREEVSSFYGRQGAYLALLYALAATDFHFENLIAAGQNPFLIDLEAVFHPRLEDLSHVQAEHVAMREVWSSVIAIGLLPIRFGGADPSEGVDLSGLGGAGGQLMPWESPYVEDQGTDQMRFQRKRLTTLEGSNRATLHGMPVDLLEYRPALIDGFTLAYRILLAHREELLSKRGPLELMRGDEIRVVLRPTGVYAKLLFESYHPDVLRDGLGRDRLLDQLWIATPNDPQLHKAISREQEDLWNGDIPIFTTSPGSRDLHHPGHEPLTDFLREPPMAGHRLSHLSDADLRRQTWFINASLAGTLIGAPPAINMPRKTSTSTEPVSREELLSISCAAGDRLLSQAFYGEQDVSWIGLSLAPVGLDLYGGLCGIALFLAYLGALTGNPTYSKVARMALTTMKRRLGRKNLELRSVGGFDGWGGVIYTLASLAKLWDDRELLAEAEGIVEWLPPLIDEDNGLDAISGSAGCIRALLALHSVCRSDRSVAVAVQCGERLLKHSQPMDDGIGWSTRPFSRPLTGVSHGASGFVLALLPLFGATGDQRFRTAALQALEYERSLFCQEKGNWLDMRYSSAPAQGAPREGAFVTAWCHGAPGIGWTRLQLLPYLQADGRVQQEIQAALQTTISQGFSGDHCLCHGASGNLEVLLEASQVLQEPQWIGALTRSTRRTFDSLQREQWISGEPLGIEVPGLMTGIAGIGYEFLRLAEPCSVPSVLSLEALSCATASAGVASGIRP